MHFMHFTNISMGRDSGVGIATRERAGRVGDRILVDARSYGHTQTGPGAHPASCIMNKGSLPRVKRPRRGVNHPPHLAPRLNKKYKCTSTHLLRFHGLFQGELYL
jgi:hypothetical protein